MKAMILAAGRGERMRPLTDTLPKPMLTVGGIPLIEHHVRKLVKVGITDIVINHAWLGHKIVEFFGDGSSFGAHIVYSDEKNQALETAGGILKALPLLLESSDDQFLVVNGDIFTDYTFTELPPLSVGSHAHLWLTDNPEHNPQGDFALHNKRVCKKVDSGKSVNTKHYTFSGIAIYSAQFFERYSQVHTDKIQPLALGPMLKQAAMENVITGEILQASWVDVGTPERLEQLNTSFDR